MGCVSGTARSRIHALKLLQQRQVGLGSGEAWVPRGLQVPLLWGLVPAMFKNYQKAQKHKDKGVRWLLLSVLGAFRNKFTSSVLGCSINDREENKATSFNHCKINFLPASISKHRSLLSIMFRKQFSSLRKKKH